MAPLAIWQTPTTNDRRDHDPQGDRIWLVAEIVKPGIRYGETDDYSDYAAQDKVRLHATILHLLGFDHTRLTQCDVCRDVRLTDMATW